MENSQMALTRKPSGSSKRAKRRDNASLYPLDPETAIRAIMEAGPHPKDDAAPNRRQPKTKRQKIG
jgi:hypothetical protein